MVWGEVFALSSALSWALAVILLRRSGENLPAFELNLIKNSLGLILMVPTILIYSGLELPVFPVSDLVLVLASGVIGIALADTWYLQALKLMGASRTGIVASLFSPFVILLSALFLGERMGSVQWVGFGAVMVGVLLVTWRVHPSAVVGNDIKKGALFGVSSVLMMAIGVVMIKDILETQSFLWTVGLRLTGGMLGMFAFILVRQRWHRVLHNLRQPQPWRTILFASFLAAYLSLLLWLAGYKLIDASVASIMNETNGTFIVLLAWLMLHEKISGRKLAGVSLTLGGVIVMMGL